MKKNAEVHEILNRKGIDWSEKFKLLSEDQKLHILKINNYYERFVFAKDGPISQINRRLLFFTALQGPQKMMEYAKAPVPHGYGISDEKKIFSHVSNGAKDFEEFADSLLG